MYTTEIYETIGLDNGLSPGGRQAIIWTNSNESSTAPRRMTFNSNFVLKKITVFLFKKISSDGYYTYYYSYCRWITPTMH